MLTGAPLFNIIPTQVTINGQNILYVYDATGVKLRKTVNTTTTDYAGNFIYENNVLQFFNQPEGYVEPSGSSFNYIYQYKDHLGNIRLSYKDISTTSTPNLQIVEENNYYPFGLKHKGYNTAINGTHHKYMFGGKELSEDLGLNTYDFGARNYDPALGRWMNLDPLAEKMRRHSPYNYAFDNPLRFTDPDGMAPDDYITSKRDGTIEIKKTDDKFDRFFVENKNGTTTQVAQLDKYKAADGITDLVTFPDEGKGFTRYGERDSGGDHSVQPKVAAALFGAINDFSSANPDVKVQFGDMSNSLGERPNATHSTHGGGRNVDFRYIRTDGAMLPVTVNSPLFDQGRSQGLINSFNKFGFNRPKSIGSFPNNKGTLLNNTFKLLGHADHGHLQNFNQK